MFSIFRSLKSRNYRLYFIGQSLSLTGTWMQGVAMGWLVYRLTGSPLMLGLVAFASQIPGFFLTTVGGVLADRYNRHRILILTQSLSMLQATLLAVLVLTGRVEFWHLMVLGLLIGTINAFDMPTRHAFVVEMLDDRQDIGNALALNSSMINAARLIGPSIAGILIASVGEGICFLINAVSFLAVITSLLLMKITPVIKAPDSTTVWQQMKTGFSYVFGFAPVKYLITLLAFVGLVGMPYGTLLPIFAKDILHGSSRTLGFLMGATGIGALAGVVFLARRKTVLGLGKVIVMASLVFGLGLMGLALSTVFWLSLVFMLLIGFGMMVQWVSCNTILQTMVEDDMRGRVMSFYVLSFLGVTPPGNLLAGAAAGWIGADYTLLISSLLCVAAAFFFARKLPAMRQMVRPIYLRKGILTESHTNT